MLSNDDKATWIASVKVSLYYQTPVAVLKVSSQCLASMRHQRLSFAAENAVTQGTHSLYDDFAFAHAEEDKTAHANSHFLAWRESSFYPLIHLV